MHIFRPLRSLRTILTLPLLLAAANISEAQDTASRSAQTSAPTVYSHPIEAFVGGQFARGKLGPDLDDSNLAGWNVSVTDYLTPTIGVTADFQGLYGRAPVTNRLGLANSPFVSQHSYFLGPQLRWRKRERYSMSERILVGATTSSFDSDLDGQSPQAFGMYPNATKLAIKIGGALDINLKPRIALRIAPGTVIQRYNGETKAQFGLSTGLVFRFGKDRSSLKRP